MNDRDDERRYQMLGELVGAMNMLEYSLTRLIWIVLRLNNRSGRVVTAGASVDRLRQTLEDCVKYGACADAETADFVSKVVSELRGEEGIPARRNAFIHSLVMRDEDGNTNLVRLGEWGKRIDLIPLREYDPEELSTVRLDALRLTGRIMTFIDEHPSEFVETRGPD